MVIVINEKNQKLYNDFFIEAYEDAKELGVVFENDGGHDDGDQTAFTDLWQYYHYLPQLAALKPVYYTKLPLDEPMMEINGDSREVKVPAQLTRCAGIQNDHLAESIMFSIGRYHDGQDLMNSTIWIQWTAENNGEKVEGVTAVPDDHRDIDFAQDMIRFPWILDSSVTQYSGIIEFSAVFFSMREGSSDIAYRYSTLPARIKIEPALQKDLADNALDVGGMFAASVRQNNYGPGFYVPVTPYFISSQGGIDLRESSDLNYATNEDVIGSLILEAQATVTDTGIINYSWKHTLPESFIEFDCGEVEEFVIPKDTAMTQLELDFVKAYADETIVLNADKKTTQEEKISYTFGTVNNNVVKKVMNSSEINKFDRYYADSAGTQEFTSDALKEAIENGADIYEKVTQFELPKDNIGQPVTGKYYIVATNTITANGITKKSKPKESSKTTLISPRDVVINEQNTIESVTFRDGKVVLDTKLESVSGEAYVINMEKSTTGVNENATTNVLTLKAAADVSGLMLDGNNDIDLSSTYGAGWYQATITAKRNRETKEDVTKIWRVLNPVTAPTLQDGDSSHAVRNDDQNGTIIDAVGENVTLSVLIDGKKLPDYFGTPDPSGKTNLLTDGYHCEWSKLELDNGYVPFAVDSTGFQTVPNTTGGNTEVYQCKLINTLNGESVSSEHRFYVL